MIDVNQFNKLKLSLATSDEIRRTSKGEVKTAETINYRTLKPEVGGLFCERIFGPSKDWECSCGKYRGVANKGIVCEKCRVLVTRNRVRRERTGHIELVRPVTHVWHFRGTPSRLSYLLDISIKDLENIIYYNAHYITSVDSQKRLLDLEMLKKEYEKRIEVLRSTRDDKLEERQRILKDNLSKFPDNAPNADEAKSVLKEQAAIYAQNEERRYAEMIENENRVWELFSNLSAGQLIKDLKIYRQLKMEYAEYFTASIGASFVEEQLKKINQQELVAELRETIENSEGAKKVRAQKRLSILNAFITSGNKLESMILWTIPVIPPELRPIVQLDGGRFFYSDLNDLYRRVIICNNALKKSLNENSTPLVINNNCRLLQEAVDSLFDNGRRGRPVTGSGNRPLKSLSDMLKGKKGRFRQNLLGKRVDYSGRSVIVVGPELKMHQCGLPKSMALELFKPFVMKRLIELSYAQNPKSAKRMVERQDDSVWDILEEVIREHPVLLNRAPTLHRLGIQAFEPLLVEGNAIKLHPLACTAFNADFDGDQMAVHLPLSVEAQAEARVLMLGANNILKPSDGKTITMPSQDMIIGLYHLTRVNSDETSVDIKKLRHFVDENEIQMAFDLRQIKLGDLIRVPINGLLTTTSFGRIIFNQTLPDDYPFVNRLVAKGNLGEIVDDLVAKKYPTVQINHTLDKMKEYGFTWSSRSGVSIAYSDIVPTDKKSEILQKAESDAEKIQAQYDSGLVTDAERRAALIELWTKCTDDVSDNMRENFDADLRNTLNTMVSSGARGNWMQVRQIAGMRGLVANPKGEIIPRPIKSNYSEGLSVLEYFIASHGARKGLADTALRTADSGYLTRRLVDVSQDIIVLKQDCETIKGIEYELTSKNKAMKTIWGRYLADIVLDKNGNEIAKRGDEITADLINEFLELGVDSVNARTLQTCSLSTGICAKCYGISMATGNIVDVGEAVGIIAAQSIGEPGTQLTMRTFHTGGVAAAADITQGLPRVAELFEARTPKGEAPIADATGRIEVLEQEHQRVFIITPDDEDIKPIEYKTSKLQKLLVSDGDKVIAGDQLTEGAVDPKKLLRIRDAVAAQKYLIDQVQEVYESQGVDIHNKHLEVIVRQMLRFVCITEPGDTEYVAGMHVTRNSFEETNRKIVSEGKQPATARLELLGITKASLKTESWLSAASFQETTRVLTDAAVEGKEDQLYGLKENIIIGRLIPAGTGLSLYTDAVAEPSDAARQAFFPNFSKDAFDAFDYNSFESGLDDLQVGSSEDFNTDTSGDISDEYLDKIQKTYFEGIEAVDEQVKKQANNNGKQGPSPYPLFQGI
ncbi:MAG: DNA-directed RNA polymerase subunit beta' [Candidatus Ancillula sp.]|jgi:DNA-directed RNA polymerase subunit beta'|nr:DNA-directed RNA polymerase subunit beta' [Candidatus Ancillula sp.]